MKTIKNIQQLWQKGEANEAKTALSLLLEKSPTDAEALHLLGVIYAEEREFNQAEEMLQKALHLKQDPSCYLHLALVFKAKGLFDQAIALLMEVITKYPRFAAAYNNLGVIYFVKQEWDHAISAYQAALDEKPDYAEAYYNLGLAFNKSDQKDQAILAYEALLLFFPKHQGAHFQLGCLYMEKIQYDRAINHFYFIEEATTSYVEAETNLASCFLKLGLFNQAREHYLKALDHVPQDIQILFNLGVMNMQQGKMRDAIHFYLKILTIDPYFYDAHYNLSIAYLALHHRDEALSHFCEILRAYPENKAVQHTIHILKQEKNITTSPSEYITSLFDSYAGHYDSHLLNALHYEVPQILYQATQEIGLPPGRDILDLGCGTGLCGALFKSFAHSISGVDLSGEMLHLARKKQIYDELIQGDIVEYLTHHLLSYDLIIAGDTLVYSGDLYPLFEAVKNALRPSGLFVFNAEKNENNQYEMTSSGRFSHHKDYLDQLILKNQLQILMYRVVVLRTQNEEEVRGHLYVLQLE